MRLVQRQRRIGRAEKQSITELNAVNSTVFGQVNPFQQAVDEVHGNSGILLTAEELVEFRLYSPVLSPGKADVSS